VYCLLGVAAAVIVLYASAWGPWAYSDGVGYLVNARNLYLGRGLGLVSPSGEFEPLVSHPPLVPALYAGISVLTGDVLLAARLLDILLAGLFIFGIGYLYYRITQSNIPAAAVSLLMLLTPWILLAFTSAMAEPLFLVGCYSGLLLLVRYVQTGKRRLFWLSSLMLATGLLSRYPALAFLGCGFVLLMLQERGALRERLKSGVLWAAVSSAPALGFVVYSRLARTPQLPRAISPVIDAIPKLGDFIHRFGKVVWSWKPVGGESLHVIELVLGRLSIAEWVFALLIGVMVVIILCFFARPAAFAGPGPSTPTGLRLLNWTMGLAIICYLIFYLAVFLVSDPTPDVDWRTMLPVLPAALILLVAGSQSIAMRHGRYLRWTVTGLLAIFMAGYFILSLDIATGLHRTGLGYTGKVWRESDTLRAVGTLNEEMPWISNEPMAILLYNDRWPFEIDELSGNGAQIPEAKYGDGPDQSQRQFREGHGYLILFNTIESQLEIQYGNDSDTRYRKMIAGLHILSTFNDGAIYRYAED